MPNHTLLFRARAIGFDISDDGWEKILPIAIASWKEACVRLSEHSTAYKEDEASITVDWQPIVLSYEHLLGVMEELDRSHGDADAYTAALGKFSHEPLEIRASVNVPAKIHPAHADALLMSYLYDTFLIMNITCPGCCNWYRSTIAAREDVISPSTEFPLSNCFFDLWRLDGLRGAWPSPKILPLGDVAEWYFSVRRGNSQLPGNKIEKTLFALLHMASNDMAMTEIVWIFYGLESLFQTKAGENFRVLLERLTILLKPSEREHAELRKGLRELYDLRSAIVHGGFEVLHPMKADGLDERVDHAFARLSRIHSFGFSLILASLQALIERHWTSMDFIEVVQGTPAPRGSCP